jgi:hypothetical protein
MSASPASTPGARVSIAGGAEAGEALTGRAGLVAGVG